MTQRSRGKSSIRPLDFREILGRLDLRVNLAANLCDVSVRQLTYWTDVGIIEEKHVGRNRRYCWADIEKVCLIKQALDDGHNLRIAAELVEAYLDQRAKEKAGHDAATAEIIGPLVEASQERIVQQPRRVAGNIRRRATPTGDLRKVLTLLESNPFQVFSARQIGMRLGRPTELVQTHLQNLEENHFIYGISYPGGDVYRFLPPRQSV